LPILLKAPSGNANAFQSFANTFFNCSFSECQHFSKLANTYLTAPSGYCSFSICLHISKLAKLFLTAIQQCQHISKLASPFLTALSANAYTFLGLPTFFSQLLLGIPKLLQARQHFFNSSH
jgi:methionyl-tRNA synthetase